MRIKDIQKSQEFAKAIWEAMQGWLWLALMWLSIGVNFTHIENILAKWAKRSDWTTWGLAILIEAINGLAFANALTNLGTALASIGKNATKEKRNRARVYFILSSVFGLAAATFSGHVNILWYNGNILAGIISPIATVICAVMEASRRYEVRVRQSSAKPTSEVGQEEAKPAKQVSKPLPTTKRRGQVFALYCQDLDQSPADLGKRFGVSAQTIRNDLGILAKQGKIIYKDGHVSLRPQKVVEARRGVAQSGDEES